MFLTAFIFFHVIISLVGIFTGLVVLFGFLKGQFLKPWNAIFLWTTVATSVTGFMIPAPKLLPSHIVGILSLLVLAITIYALYAKKLAGGWKRTYAITALVALYFNIFVGVVQGFLRIPFLHALAPTQAEPPFAIAQGGVLLIVIILGVLAAKRFKSAV